MFKFSLTLFAIIFAATVFGQSMGSDPLAFRLNAGQESYNEVTLIDGKPVSGIPYMFISWMKGRVRLKSGRAYTQYPLRYDILNQKVLFKNGEQSMEIEEEVDEFTLDFKGEHIYLVNGSHYNAKKPVFFEIMMDNSTGVLLKSNHKEIGPRTESAVQAANSSVFRYYSEIYFFRKSDNKLFRIKKQGDMKKALEISDESSLAIKMSTYDFLTEKGIFDFVNDYFIIKEGGKPASVSTE